MTPREAAEAIIHLGVRRMYIDRIATVLERRAPVLFVDVEKPIPAFWPGAGGSIFLHDDSGTRWRMFSDADGKIKTQRANAPRSAMAGEALRKVGTC